jgi:hypothetical protein
LFEPKGQILFSMFLNFFLIKEANMFVDVKLVKPNTGFESKERAYGKRIGDWPSLKRQ